MWLEEGALGGAGGRAQLTLTRHGSCPSEGGSRQCPSAPSAGGRGLGPVPP